MMPLAVFFLLIVFIIIAFNINSMKSEDKAYVETIEIPLVSTINLHQSQETQMLLSSIAKFRNWISALIILNDNIVVSAYPYENSTLVGREFLNNCESPIVLKQRDQTIGKICYERERWAFVDRTMITVIVGTILMFLFIYIFYQRLLNHFEYVFNRLSKVIDLLENSTKELLSPEFLEEQKIITALDDKLKLIKEINVKEIERHESQARVEIAEQVSHDIKSPLEALKSIVMNEDGNISKNLYILKNVIIRINSIVEDLSSSKQLGNSKENKVSDLGKVLEYIFLEKKSEYEKNGKNNFLFQNYLNSRVELIISESDLLRIISNLINNSFEAISDNGEVKLILKHDEGKIKVIVSDSGKGMASDIVSRIGQRGLSIDKNGNGLGLYNAKRILESSGAILKIQSQENVGTTITIEFAESDCLIFSNKKENLFFEYVYIDNDELCRVVWHNIALKKGVSLLVLEQLKDFDNYIERIDKNFTRIYIDSDLGEKSIKGEEFALELHKKGYKMIYIATGFPESRFKDYTWLNYSTKKCPI